MSRLLVYPERKRCYACRRYFGFAVLLGLYCSRECAGLPPWRPPAPPPDCPVGALPRQCRTVYRANRNPPAYPKVRYRSEADARDFIRVYIPRPNPPDVYECSNCGFWHVGSKHNLNVVY